MHDDHLENLEDKTSLNELDGVLEGLVGTIHKISCEVIRTPDESSLYNSLLHILLSAFKSAYANELCRYHASVQEVEMHTR